ncbi:hypothetical protein GGU10DRAFT_380579 [Lentinula aff. detonsa]|uniref:Uncharacterized protein n=1 Tax=Lentinula aff. detonsa TaxID=2804958 RepID=A0AA38KWK5_9AGAR|nr:hypothetical protein GGU10DRAFT_380579 [Lentinula aff. detonsa]
MSDSGNSDAFSRAPSHATTLEPQEDLVFTTLPAMLQRFDLAQEEMLENLDFDAPFHDLDKSAVEKYINLVLCGYVNGPVPDLYSLETPEEHPEILRHRDSCCYRDVDSALIFGRLFPWLGQYDILTTFQEKKSLKGYLHAHVKFDEPGEAEATYRDPGSDPNVFWGVCGPAGRHRIYLMLPMANPVAMDEVHEQIYMAGWEAVQQILPSTLATWSPTYQAELDRSKRFQNFGYQTESRKSIPIAAGTVFANRVMSLIRAQEWGRSAYWFIQIRGSKDTTRHLDRNFTEANIDSILTDIDRDGNIIFLDMAIEVHLPQGWASMPARYKECHFGMARLLWGFEEEDWDYDNYHPDIWAGITDFAGFRANFSKSPRTRNLISYIQVYTTDKFQTYKTSGKAFRIFGSQILKMTDPDLIPVPLRNVYEATAENQVNVTPCVTRFEARVPLHRARHIYNTDIRPAALARVLHVVRTEVIWAWRCHRVLACTMLIRYASSVKKDSRLDMEYLTLIATLLHFFNGIHCRPNEMSWDRTLARTIFETGTLQERVARDIMFWSPRSQKDSVPIMAYGALWLPPIVFPRPGVGDVLRFHHRNFTASRTMLCRVIGMKWDEIQTLFIHRFKEDRFKGGVIRPKKTTASSSPLKRQIELPTGYKDFSYKKPRAYFDHGPDLPAAALVGATPSDDTDRAASEMFLGLLTQIMERLGTMGRTHIPYCKLSDDQIRTISLDTFRDPNLSTYLLSYQYTQRPEDWASLKSVLFPDDDDVPPRVGAKGTQGWRLLPLYNELLMIREDDPAKYRPLRNFCRNAFDTLMWFPKVSRDRLIDNKVRSSWTHIFAGSTQNGTPIAINPKFKNRVTQHANRPPVLTPAALIDDPEATAGPSERTQAEAHQATLSTFAQSVFGPYPPPEETITQQAEQIDVELVEWAQKVSSRSRGRYRLMDLTELQDDEMHSRLYVMED